MIIKERKWSHCKECKQKLNLTQEETYGCDNCKKPFSRLFKGVSERNLEYLEMVVFWKNGDEATRFHICTWTCVMKILVKLNKQAKEISFITLPYIHFDERAKGQTISDLLKIIGKNK